MRFRGASEARQRSGRVRTSAPMCDAIYTGIPRLSWYKHRARGFVPQDLFLLSLSVFLSRCVSCQTRVYRLPNCMESKRGTSTASDCNSRFLRILFVRVNRAPAIERSHLEHDLLSLETISSPLFSPHPRIYHSIFRMRVIVYTDTGDLPRPPPLFLRIRILSRADWVFRFRPERVLSTHTIVPP